MPPTVPGEYANQPQTTWPQVIGVISLVYALLGMVCIPGSTAWLFFMEGFMKSMSGMDVVVPPMMKVITASLAVVGMSLGVVLLIGAVKTMRRRRGGPAVLKAWVVLRLLLVVVGLAAGLVMVPMQVEMERSIQESTNRKAAEAGGPTVPFDEQGTRVTTIVITVGSAGFFSVYPLFLGIWLTRRTIRDEVATWD
jgi:uncharacterized membrane protein